MIQILVSDGLEKSAVAKLEEMGYAAVLQFYGPEELGERLQSFDALVIRSKTKVRAAIIDQAAKTGRLKLIVRAGVGVDNVDVAYAESKGIAVENTPGASTESVAELAVGLMFGLARHIYAADRSMHRGEWEKKLFEGTELAGKTLGLIGLGRIGKRVAAKATALGMRAVYTNRSGHRPENEPYRHLSLDELCGVSDYISLHMPKADEVILSAGNFEKMKNGVCLINTSRGGLIDEKDLLDALDAGKIAAAALDVFAEEPCANQRLRTHPKLLLTPHIGASTSEAQRRVGEEVVQKIVQYFS
ncbi:MAG: D-2-hydroxyacid dehydrogenase [Synergistaceae bacterium]|jgi:D-3-phosphoglycerate dehydrogenase|nr:D-2-hydroxyacid dehydrogenase [Synergistaceae bacterium]